MLDDAWILGRKCGQHFVANPHPLEGALVIGGVVDECKPAPGGIGPHIGTTAIEQRADDPIGPSGFDPSETAEPGATQNTREYRFRLVILGVAHRNTGSVVRGGDL